MIAGNRHALPVIRPAGPWQEEPYRLWSLLEMLRFYAASFIAATSALARAQAVVQFATGLDVGDTSSWDRRLVKNALDEAGPPLNELPLSRVLQDQFERITERLEHASGNELQVMLREYMNNLMVELSSPYFLMIPASERWLYEQPNENIWGDDVGQKFRKAKKDIAACARCLALAEWTACVFHSMRAVEFALRHIAKKVGLPSGSMDQENWKNIIDQIEKKIREMEKQPKSPQKARKVRELSECAVQFRYFKDAWRNHVAHSHVSYDEREAREIYLHVMNFMTHLAGLR